MVAHVSLLFCSHPIALVFFVVFRLGALLTYLLGSIFTDNFTLIFVITILLLAFDFWTVKNVSGRLLVGLRWWNEIQEDGTNKWVFESANVSHLSYLWEIRDQFQLTQGETAKSRRKCQRFTTVLDDSLCNTYSMDSIGIYLHFYLQICMARHCRGGYHSQSRQCVRLHAV